MKQWPSLISGLAGSIALTLLHEVLKRTVNDAPRMDELGKEGLSKVLSASGSEIPSDDNLQKITLGGDILGNAGYYSMVGLKPKYSVVIGAALGLTAGIGAVALPDKLGLNEEHSNATNKTKVLTVLLYLTGGLVAGGVYKFLERKAARKIIH